jgi:hypothetical protein
MRVEQRQSGAGEDQRIAVRPAARPRPRRDRRWRRKDLPFWGFRRVPLGLRALDGRRGNALCRDRREVDKPVEIGANHVTMVNRQRLFVS